MQCSTVDVTLDSNTANPLLTLSADGKRVRLGEEKQAVPDNPQRFDHRLCVLGREGFISGRHYWEVEVGENTFWRLGVTSESAERKRGFIMTPQHGYWTIEWWEIGNQFSALIDPHAPLPLSMKPRKLGVYLDYEEGQLSFYNVEARSLIYTFIDFNANEKLYPIFWTMDREIDLMLQSTVSTGN
ncbi:butyrophilin subfamily 3 member A3-like [Acipenser ruthenus]|uniref:butyrophilin subfamily 3 member A3-like n=1 Tax=Acipenser ruthenus TaxID=7906 RepID=UPI002742298D|nr:butyrophilin subfamily 3 member A3-like [Acipenser ruthenus]